MAHVAVAWAAQARERDLLSRLATAVARERAQMRERVGEVVRLVESGVRVLDAEHDAPKGQGRLSRDGLDRWYFGEADRGHVRRMQGAEQRAGE